MGLNHSYKHTIKKRSEPLQHTFMLLSFITSFLLIMIQAGRKPSDVDSTPASNSADNIILTEATPTAITPLPSRPLEAAPVNISSSLVVDLSDRILYLYLDNILRSNYIIAVGKPGWETPTGNYEVINLQVSPSWQHPFTGETIPAGPDNPLGSRWIGFWTDGKNQIGFHGTNQPDLLGQAVSHGCIRMRDEEIQTLYTQIVMGTPVVVRP